jgi:GAF domain-containing protein
MPTDIDILADFDRLNAMMAYDLFDSDLAQELHRICRASAERLNVSLTAVQAVLDTATATLATNGGDADFLSALGGAPNELSFCPNVVIGDAPYIRENLAVDPEHYGNPAVTAGLVQSYAGVPLTLQTGHILGSYCVMNPSPHTFSDGDIADLTTSAKHIVDAIGHHPKKPH